MFQVKLPSNQTLRWRLVGRKIILEYSWDQPLRERKEARLGRGRSWAERQTHRDRCYIGEVRSLLRGEGFRKSRAAPAGDAEVGPPSPSTKLSSRRLPEPAP